MVGGIKCDAQALCNTLTVRTALKATIATKHAARCSTQPYSHTASLNELEGMPHALSGSVDTTDQMPDAGILIVTVCMLPNTGRPVVGLSILWNHGKHLHVLVTVTV